MISIPNLHNANPELHSTYMPDGKRNLINIQDMEELEPEHADDKLNGSNNVKGTPVDGWASGQGSNVKSWERKYEKLKSKFHSEKKELETKLEDMKQSFTKIKEENVQLLTNINYLEKNKADQSANIQKYDSLERQMKSTQNDNSNLKRNLQTVETKKKSLQEKIHILTINNQSLKDQKEELLLRLSKFAGAQLTHDNPDIADLSDSKRPTKLAEEFTELYDNEWTDAFEHIEIEPEHKKTAFLLRLLQRTNQICSDTSKRHMGDIKSSLCTIYVVSKTPEEISCAKNDSYDKAEYQELEDKRKRLKFESLDTSEEFEFIEKDEVTEDMQTSKTIHVPAKSMTRTAKVNSTCESLIFCDLNTLQSDKKQAIIEAKQHIEVLLSGQLQTVITDIIAKENEIDIKKQESIVRYIQKCTSICWSMCQHEPPVFVDFPDEKIDMCLDTNVYKPYTKIGKLVDFVVWPALHLYKGGPQLCKGVAQGRS